MRKRLGIISLFALLFIGFVVVWNYSYQQGLEGPYIPVESNATRTLIPSESGVFRDSDHALDYEQMIIDESYQRTLESYYNNRAYPGAPPSIQHPVRKERDLGGNVCLQCHQNGGFVQKFDAYAPISPHPEMINCRQCHVTQNTKGLFAETTFTKVSPPQVGVNNALLGSPPMIPHALTMRENCLSCHAGPSAPVEIRVTHPERINCRQCHVPNTVEYDQVEVFSRNLQESHE
ncbi:cytochrome C [Flagellimonas sp.]|uniref:cytochrome C n=1 Tax=Flagellimonas sp. TaxID=2058762 RepID=UPI003B52834F